MRTHEIRLLKIDGSTALIYVMMCETALEAEAHLTSIEGVLYDRYEIRRGELEVASGPNPNTAL